MSSQSGIYQRVRTRSSMRKFSSVSVKRVCSTSLFYCQHRAETHNREKEYKLAPIFLFVIARFVLVSLTTIVCV